MAFAAASTSNAKGNEQKVVAPTGVKQEGKEKGPNSTQASTGQDMSSQSEAILKALGDSCTPEMKAALEKMAETAPKPKLTHSHLSRVERAKKAKMTLKEKIESLDVEWRKFQKLVEDRVNMQRTSYLEQRATLVNQYKEKQILYQQLQMEMQQMALSSKSDPEVVDLEKDTGFTLDLTAEVDSLDEDLEEVEPTAPKRVKTEMTA